MIMRIPVHYRITLLAGVLLAAACAPLQPVEMADERAVDSVDSELWTTLQPALDSDWHVLLNRGLVALDWRLTAIDSAAKSIDLQTFLLKPDAVGAAVLEHLLAAADRGVEVRFLIDDTFLNGQDELVMYMHEHDNIRLRVFNPFERRVDDMLTRQLLNIGEFQRLDHRMHNKAMIVDGRVAIVGGRNLADEYFGIHSEANFRDLEVMVGGAIVRDISQSFADYWNDDWSFPLERLSHVQVRHMDREVLAERAAPLAMLHRERTETELARRWTARLADSVQAKSILLVDEPPEGNPADAAEAPVQLANDLVDLIDEAREEVVMISAYLIPTPVLEEAVRRAEKRGVTVRLLTNSITSNNHLMAHSAYRNHIQTLMGHGAELFEVRSDAQDRAIYIRNPVSNKSLGLHAKALILDRHRVFIGSANLDPRSLRINTEMGLLVESEEFNASMRSAVAADFATVNSWKLTFDSAGGVVWVSGDDVLMAQPADSSLQRIEDWFFAHLPIEDEL